MQQNEKALITRDAFGVMMTIGESKGYVEVLDEDRDQYIVLTKKGTLIKVWKRTHFMRILKQFNDQPK